MKKDMVECMMIIAGRNLVEYEQIKKLSTEMFLIKYKVFIDDLITKE